MLNYNIKKTQGDTTWFRKDRFGMFIHFGLYSVPARHEWIKTMEKQTDKEYDRYVSYFNPDLFNAKEWAPHVLLSDGISGAPSCWSRTWFIYMGPAGLEERS